MSTSTEQWFDAWRDLLSKQPWQSTLEAWWRQFSTDSESSPSPVFEKIAAQSHSFFELAEELIKLGSGNSGDVAPGPGMDRMFDDLKRALDTPPDNPAAGSFWQIPVAGWQQFVSSMPGMSQASMPTGIHPGAFSPPAGMDALLSTPALGYTRESQGEVKKMARLSAAYLEAQRRYNAFFADMGKASLDVMRRRLAERAEQGEPPLATVREFYDLWVECSEKVYRERTMTDEYSRLNGEMVNALMALRRQYAAMMDDITGQMNMPTREELDTLHLQSQEARRHARRLEGKLRELGAREAELARRLAGLGERINAGPAAGSKPAKGKRSSRAKKGSGKGAGSGSAGKATGKKQKQQKKRNRKQ